MSMAMPLYSLTGNQACPVALDVVPLVVKKKQQQTDVTVGLQGWCEVPYLSLVFSSSNSDQREIFNSVFKS